SIESRWLAASPAAQNQRGALIEGGRFVLRAQYLRRPSSDAGRDRGRVTPGAAPDHSRVVAAETPPPCATGSDRDRADAAPATPGGPEPLGRRRCVLPGRRELRPFHPRRRGRRGWPE